jgi:hypothetical protein
MDRTSAQPQVNLSLLHRSYLNFQPLVVPERPSNHQCIALCIRHLKLKRSWVEHEADVRVGVYLCLYDTVVLYSVLQIIII